MIDDLSLDEQDDLINIIRHRQIEKRREEIAKNIYQARQEALFKIGLHFEGKLPVLIEHLF